MGLNESHAKYSVRLYSGIEIRYECVTKGPHFPVITDSLCFINNTLSAVR